MKQAREFTPSAISQLPAQSDCLIAGVFAKNELSALASELDKKSGGAITRFLEQGDLSGKTGQTALLYNLSGVPSERILLVACGSPKGINDQEFYKILRGIGSALKQTKTPTAAYGLTDIKVNGHDMNWQLRQAVMVLREEFYAFTDFKSKPETAPSLKELYFLSKSVKAAQEAINTGTIIADSVSATKDLAYMPPNVCTPAYLAEKAQALANEISSLKVEVLEETQMQELKMGALLAVAQGSKNRPRFIIIRYQGAEAREKPVVLVGKGITFDTGGIQLKPSAGILGMKFDMCGAASVFGALKAAALLKLPLNIVGVMVCVENMIGSNAYLPDCVITSMSGQTIEVNNTDAEGRLILCDALTYCERFKPDVIIDMATLTGAIITALGKHATGLFSNDQKLADDLLKAGSEIGDRAWQLPVWEDYQSQLDSTIADFANTGSGGANSITAACFLARFTKEYRWAHLDIAGTAFQTGAKASATGRPVPLLLQYLLDRSV